MNIFLRNCAVLILLCAPNEMFAREGKVTLNNGRTIVGDIAKGEGGSIVVSRTTGSIHFTEKEIARVDYYTQKRSERHPFYYALYEVPKGALYGSKPDAYDKIIRSCAGKYQLSPALVKAVIHAESNFNPFDVSCKGASGLMQLMPFTACGLGVNNVFNPHQNIDGGCKYLRAMLDEFNGNLRFALAAYNAGPNAVKKYKGIPPYSETRSYVKNVLKLYEKYRNKEGDVASFLDDHGVMNFTNFDLGGSEIRQ